MSRSWDKNRNCGWEWTPAELEFMNICESRGIGPGETCRSVSGQERQYNCTLREGHLQEGIECEWFNTAPHRGTEPGFYDYQEAQEDLHVVFEDKNLQHSLIICDKELRQSAEAKLRVNE